MPTCHLELDFHKVCETLAMEIYVERFLFEGAQ